MIEGAPRPLTLALYQPDIPQNCGTMLRLCACLGVAAAIVAPAGFAMSDRALRRAGLDYLDHVVLARHASFSAFLAWRETARRRLVLLSSKARQEYCDFRYAAGDVLIVGRESAGVPDEVYAAVDGAVRIPVQPPLRCLNVAVAAAMVLGEAIRQISEDGDDG